MERSTSYIFGFAGVVCFVCGVLVSSAAVSLKPLQEVNATLDRQKKVLIVAGLLEVGSSATSDEIAKLFGA